MDLSIVPSKQVLKKNEFKSVKSYRSYNMDDEHRRKDSALIPRKINCSMS